MSLVVWLPLTKDLRQQGLSNVTATNNGATFNSAGKLGGCYNIDNASLTFANPLPSTCSEFSICGWVNLNSNFVKNNGLHIISWGGTYSRICVSKDGAAVKVLLSNSAMIASNALDSTVVAEVWNHYAVTFKNGVVCIYINGILDKQITIGISSVTFASTTTTIGNYSSEIAHGKLNDFRIYDHALSSMEVKELAKGLVLHYPLNRQGWGQENIIPNSKIDGSWTYPSSSVSDKYSKVTTVIPSATQYTLSFDAKSTVNGDKMRTHYYSPNTTTTCVSSQGITKAASDGNMDFTLSTQWQRYWVIYTQTETTAVKHLICPRLVSGQGSGTVSVKNVKLEEGPIATPWCPNSSDALATTMGLNSTTEYDCSGFGNNGTKWAYDTAGTIDYMSDTPKYQVSTYINSDNNTTNTASGTRYIYGNCELTTPQYLTVAFWCKPIAGYGNQTGQGQFSLTNNAIGTSAGQDYDTCPMNHRDSYIDMCTSSGTHKTMGITFTANEWHHYVIVYDGRYGRVYKDGIATGQTLDMGSVLPLKNMKGVVIGFSRAGGVWRSNKSYYSDFRIYTTALSADDVKSLYQNSAYIDSSGNVYGAVHEEV